MTGEASVHRAHGFGIGGYDLVAAIFAFVSAYAYFKLYRIKTRYQKENANAEDGDELPNTFRDQECRQEDPRKQDCYADTHNDPHGGPDRLVLLLDFFRHIQQKLLVFLIIMFHTDFLPT